MTRLFLLLLLPFALDAMPENHFIQSLWEGAPPNAKESSLKEEARNENQFLVISKVQDPSIEVCLPSAGNATGQAVVVCPGGGYGILAYDWEGSDIASALNSRGIAAIILKYRLPEDESNVAPQLSPLIDAKRALRATRYNAKEWGIDPQQIGVMGFSAGGHLASTLGTHFDAGDPQAKDPVDRMSSRPDFMILIYPVISMKDGVTHQGSKKNLIGKAPSEALVDFYSNELQVTENTPPTFLLHSGDDGTVPVENSLLFYKALLNKGVEAEMHVYPYGGHGFSLALNKGRLRNWMGLCLDWIEAHND